MVIDEAPRYSVSSMGCVRNDETGLILKTPLHENGYYRVMLYVPGRPGFNRFVHRLMALAFFHYENWYEELEVNHIDGDKTNNFIGNLEWNTQSENMLHAYQIGLKTPSGGVPRKPVRIIETGIIYESIAACARAIGARTSDIGNALHGRQATVYGYTFEYA